LLRSSPRPRPSGRWALEGAVVSTEGVVPAALLVLVSAPPTAATREQHGDAGYGKEQQNFHTQHGNPL